MCVCVGVQNTFVFTFDRLSSVLMLLCISLLNFSFWCLCCWPLFQ